MNTVICVKCEHTVQIDSCWCVIDTKTKVRLYECMGECLRRPIEIPEAKIEAIEVEIPSTMLQPVEDGIPAYPRQGILERITNWFYRPAGYERVKRE